MSKHIFLSAVLLCPQVQSAEPTVIHKIETKIRIAVIDTGLDVSATPDIPLCAGLHADLTVDKKGMMNPPKDTHEIKHGTNISALIHKYAGTTGKSYCQIIIKYYPYDERNALSSSISSRAFAYAAAAGADIINYSSSGMYELKDETREIQKAMSRGIKVVVSAGNDEVNIDKQPRFPAAADPQIIVVGNLDLDETRFKSSNYGKIVDYWEIGTGQTAGGVTLTGTSQATAIVSGKLLSAMRDDQNVIELRTHPKNKARTREGARYEPTR